MTPARGSLGVFKPEAELAQYPMGGREAELVQLAIRIGEVDGLAREVTAACSTACIVVNGGGQRQWEGLASTHEVVDESNHAASAGGTARAGTSTTSTGGTGCRPGIRFSRRWASCARRSPAGAWTWGATATNPGRFAPFAPSSIALRIKASGTWAEGSASFSCRTSRE